MVPFTVQSCWSTSNKMSAVFDNHIMSVVYRYRCVSENGTIFETRADDAGPPTVCVNDGSDIVSGSLAVYERIPTELDIQYPWNSTVNFNNCNVLGLAHASLDEVGTHSHTELDSHIDDDSLHRTINDGATGPTDLWSAEKIQLQLDEKSDAVHTHNASSITNFQATVSANSNVSANTTHRSAVNNPHSVTKAQVGLGNVPDLKVNHQAVNDPTVNDDSSAGYSTGSNWVNVSTDKVFYCVDATVGAASWKRLDIASHGDLSGAGSNTHVQIDSHLADATLHRVINDSAVTSTNLWSALKIATELSAKSNVGHTHSTLDLLSGVLEVSRGGTGSASHAVGGLLVGSGSAPLIALKSVWNAISDPTGSDDSPAGFSVGSRWINVATDTEHVCLDNSVGSAVWKETTVSSPGGGDGTITSTLVSSSTDTSTTSDDYVVMNTMSTTPAEGTYRVTFSASGTSSRASADSLYALFIDNSIRSHTERYWGVSGGNHVNQFVCALHTQDVVTLDGSQTVSVRYKTDRGSFTVYQRSMVLLKIS